MRNGMQRTYPSNVPIERTDRLERTYGRSERIERTDEPRTDPETKMEVPVSSREPVELPMLYNRSHNHVLGENNNHNNTNQHTNHQPSTSVDDIIERRPLICSKPCIQSPYYLHNALEPAQRLLRVYNKISLGFTSAAPIFEPSIVHATS